MIDNELRGEVERCLRNAKGITVPQVLNLMEKAWKAAENHLIENAVVPIIEFFLRLKIHHKHLQKKIGTYSRRKSFLT